MIDLKDYRNVVNSMERCVFRMYSTLAQDFERDLFCFMRNNLLKRVYVINEMKCDGSNVRIELTVSKDKPKATMYTMYDFTKLLEYDDDYFERLPYSTNKVFVEEWRKTLKNKGEK